MTDAENGMTPHKVFFPQQHTEEALLSFPSGRRAGPRETHVSATTDLPAYILRLSDRARHVRLTITPHEGLVVVVPRRARGFDPAPVLREKRAWIEASMAHFAELRDTLQASPEEMLPSRVEFPATGESWPVTYRRTESQRVTVRASESQITVVGATFDAEACLCALNRWLQASAKKRLLPMLESESERVGVRFRRAGIRGQRSRWGGCSGSGSITLNRCLLFLPAELVRAVVLHELAHVLQPNHSAAFWSELEALDPDVARHRQAIRAAWSAVPVWAERGTRARS